MSNECGRIGDVTKTYVVEVIQDDVPLSACTGIVTDFIDSCSHTGITLSDSIIPNSDNTINLGDSSRRFRDINTISGTSSVWTSTNRVITPILDLGLDSSGNTRTITADNSIILGDFLIGGGY